MTGGDKVCDRAWIGGQPRGEPTEGFATDL